MSIILNVFELLTRNRYVKLILILTVLHVFISAIGGVLTRFDYILLVFIISLKDIDGDNALWYAIILGVFYDTQYQIFFGVGILLFQVLSLLKIQLYSILDMGKLHSRILFVTFLILLYLTVTLYLLGYSKDGLFLNNLVIYFANNIIVTVIVLFVFTIWNEYVS